MKVANHRTIKTDKAKVMHAFERDNLEKPKLELHTSVLDGNAQLQPVTTSCNFWQARH